MAGDHRHHAELRYGGADESGAIPDFHQFLRDYIDLQERDLRRFKEPDGCVYVCELSRRGELCGDMEFGPFSDFEHCLSAAIRRAAEEETVGLRISSVPWIPGRIRRGRIIAS